MILLDIAKTLRLPSGRELPRTLQDKLLDSTFTIISATFKAPFVHWKPFQLPVSRITDERGAVLTERVSLSASGCLQGKLEWLGQLQDGFRLLNHIASELEKEGKSDEARELHEILARLNLLLGIVEGIRDGEQINALTKIVTPHVDRFLRTFQDFTIITPELLGFLVAAYALEQRGISNEPDYWEQVLDVAFELADQAEPIAAQARKSKSYSDFLNLTLTCMPLYEGAVRLFYYAMIGYHAQTGQQPTEIIRDFRVIEEYRVGAEEVIGYLGEHLVSRVGIFLMQGRGLPIKDAVRKAFNSLRAQVSVCPDAARQAWLVAADEAVPEEMLTEDNLWTYILFLEQRVKELLPTCYEDSWFARKALSFHDGSGLPMHFDLQEGWQKRLFDVNQTLLAHTEIALTGTTVHHNIAAESILTEAFHENEPASTPSNYKVHTGCEEQIESQQINIALGGGVSLQFGTSEGNDST
jgi:hypothetical protein